MLTNISNKNLTHGLVIIYEFCRMPATVDAKSITEIHR